MKIFFYINTISSGGAERVLTNLATEMSVRGHKCTIPKIRKQSQWQSQLQ